MASKRPQTMAKRARELAVKERRDRKRAKKAEAAAQRAAGETNSSPTTTHSEYGYPLTDDAAAQPGHVP
jgi:hypothetical protein